MKTAKKIIVYTDGGARGNPGPAAIGVVIKNAEEQTMKQYGEAIGIATNNEAEYRAVVFALAKLKSLVGSAKAKITNVEVRLDSELVARQLNGTYKIEEERLFPFFIKIWNYRIDFGSLSFRHIPREKNKEADMLVNAALDAQSRPTLFG